MIAVLERKRGRRIMGDTCAEFEENAASIGLICGVEAHVRVFVRFCRLV